MYSQPEGSLVTVWDLCSWEPNFQNLQRPMKNQSISEAWAGFGVYAGTETTVRADLGVCFRDRKRGQLGAQALRLQTAADCILWPAQTTMPWTSRCYSVRAESYVAWVDAEEAAYCTAPLPLQPRVLRTGNLWRSVQLCHRPLSPRHSLKPS